MTTFEYPATTWIMTNSKLEISEEHRDQLAKWLFRPLVIIISDGPRPGDAATKISRFIYVEYDPDCDNTCQASFELLADHVSMDSYFLMALADCRAQAESDGFALPRLEQMDAASLMAQYLGWEIKP